MDENDDDYFDDDGLELLPQDTLLQLEQDAIARGEAHQQLPHGVSNASLLQGNRVQSIYEGSTLGLPRQVQIESHEYGDLEAAEVLDGDDQSAIALEQLATFTEPSLRYNHTEDVHHRDGESMLRRATDNERRALADVDRMEVEEKGFDDPFHGSSRKMEELASHVEQVSAVPLHPSGC